jgi:hypothetical protein
VEERQEAAINGRRSQSQSECALTYMNASSGENLSAVRTVHMNTGAYGVRIMRRTRQRHGHARFFRTTATCIRGRERPPKTCPGTVIGGWQRGSLTPPMPPPLLSTTAPSATRAAQSAAHLTAVKSLIAKNIDTSPTDAMTFLSRLLDQRTAHEQRGPLLPSLCSPRPFFASANSKVARRGGMSRASFSLDVLSEGSSSTNKPRESNRETGR